MIKIPKVLVIGSGPIVIGQAVVVGKLADVGQPTQQVHPTQWPFRLWQHGFYDFNIFSDEKLLEKLDYIHSNPVRAGLVLSPRDYKWSSYKEYFEEKSQTQLGQHAENLGNFREGDVYAQAR